MLAGISARVSRVVTDRPGTVIVLMLVLTVGVGAGIGQLDMEEQTDIDDEIFETTEVGTALSYMESNYDAGEQTAISSVYVRPAEENALSRESLHRALAYQATVLESEAVASELTGEGVSGPSVFVGEALAGENATVEQMQSAIETASDETLASAIERTLADPDQAGEFLPRSYVPGTTEAESFRIAFEFEKADVTQQQEPLPDERAQAVLFETAQDEEGIFTMGVFAQEEWDEQQILDIFWLIVPPALLLVIGVLAFAYRDIIDVMLGFIGVCVSVVWFFGILGWLGIPAGFASIVGPILIIALSIDFGLHVFMRYREQRSGENALRAGRTVASEGRDPRSSEDRIREPMLRASASVMVAFLLVAVTASVGFLANATNPVGFIRAFGVVISLGVLAAVLVFVTLIPALKVGIESVLEARGISREKSALGTRGLLKPVLSSGVWIAQRGALAVILLAVVAGGLGLVAYTDLDRQGFQQDFTSEDDWQTSLPDPIGWSAHETEYRQQLDYVRTQFQSDDERERTTAFLIRGNVSGVTALERIHTGTQAAEESNITFKQDDKVAAISPLSAIVAATIDDEQFAGLVAGVGEENDAFAALLAAVGEENEAFEQALDEATPLPVGADVTELYDALSETAPAEMAEVTDRTDGEYRSMRLLVPVDQTVDIDKRDAEMHAIADEMEADGITVVPVDFATVSNAGLGAIADSILWTMLLAFGGVAVVLGGLYRIERQSATLGAVTVVPIILVVGLVFGGMYLAGVALTFITAFLVSITIGLGIDYNIHISDRFVQELERGSDPVEALYTTVRGTGGALLGSALTSGVAFATLLLHPSVVFQSFGAIVVLALVLSFVVSVLVLPSFLLYWAQYRHDRR